MFTGQLRNIFFEKVEFLWKLQEEQWNKKNIGSFKSKSTAWRVVRPCRGRDRVSQSILFYLWERVTVEKGSKYRRIEFGKKSVCRKQPKSSRSSRPCELYKRGYKGSSLARSCHLTHRWKSTLRRTIALVRTVYTGLNMEDVEHTRLFGF